MMFSAEDYNVLAYLLNKNKLSHSQVVDWAYSQYTDEGVDPFIEKISLAYDVKDMLELISNEYQVYGEPEAEFLLGEAASEYAEGKLSLYQSICKVLFDIEVELPKESSTNLYIAEDYYGWHDQAEQEASKLALPIFNQYRPVYEQAVSKFIA